MTQFGGRIETVDMLYPTAVPLTFIDQHPAKHPPTGIADGLGQRVVLEHSTHVQVLDLDVPGLINYPPTELVQKVGSLVGNLFVLAGQGKAGFFPPLTALLAPGQRAVQPPQLLLGLAQVLGVRNFFARAQYGEILQSQVNPKLWAGVGWFFNLHLTLNRDEILAALGFRDGDVLYLR